MANSLTLQLDTERQSSGYKSVSKWLKLGRERIVLRFLYQEVLFLSAWACGGEIKQMLASLFGQSIEQSS